MKQHTMRFNLYSAFLISIMIPLILIFFIFSYCYSHIHKQDNEKNIANTLQTISTNIETQISELNYILNTPYLYQTAMNYLRNVNSGNKLYQEDAIMENQLESGYNITLAKLMRLSSQDINRVSFYPANSESACAYLISNAHETLQPVFDDSYHQSDWFQTACSSDGKLIFSVNPPDGREESSFSATRLIVDYDKNQSVGVLKIDIGPDKILSPIARFIPDSDSGLFLCAQNGDVIYTNSGSSAMHDISNVHDFLSEDSASYTPITAPILDYQLELTYLLSKREILFYEIGLYVITIAISAAVVFIAFFFYRIRSKHMVSSIDSILKEFQEIEKGNLDVSINIQSPSELKQISDGFNHMVQALNHHIDQEYKAVLKEKEAHYMALQSQINPHFLYNTLNEFVGLNKMGKKALLERSIIDLARLFQYTCHYSDTVFLKDEISFIRQYLELQALKYDEDMEYSIQVSDAAGKEKIPKFLLQPLIENAILHGVKPSRHPVHIFVYADLHTFGLKKDHLLILIADDGAGFDTTGGYEKSAHTGLTNIAERFHYFNPHSAFHIESFPGRGTKILMILENKTTQEP